MLEHNLVSPNNNVKSKLKFKTKAKVIKAETDITKAVKKNTVNIANIKDNIIKEVKVNKLTK